MSDGAAALLRERLAGERAVLPFAEAVLAELTGLAGPLADAPLREREALAREIVEILLGAGGADDALLARLLDDPALGAAFFQNVDLLYAHRWPRADEVAALVMRLLEAAARLEAGGVAT